ncbi:hypothetical protein LTR74_007006 [Friedmanniomyces endolithicus]|nr:hypothetical protein LTR74_007006 [Friedmanniomyces endolithicus]
MSQPRDFLSSTVAASKSRVAAGFTAGEQRAHYSSTYRLHSTHTNRYSPKQTAEHAPATPFPVNQISAHHTNNINTTHSAPHANAHTRMCIYDATHYACTAEDMILVQQCPCLPHCLPHIRQTLFRTTVCRLCAIAGLEEGARIVSAAGVREEGGCYGGVARPWEMSRRHFRGEGAGSLGLGMGLRGGAADLSRDECVDGIAEAASGMGRAGGEHAELYERMGKTGDPTMVEGSSAHGDDREERDVDEEEYVDAL